MYFNNSPYTVETLKKEFRTLANQLHPDHGGNEEEFKTMMAEYSRLLASLDGGNKYTNSDTTADYMRRKWAEYQAKQAAEREEAERERRAEEAARRAEAAQEAERVRQAQEVAAAAVRAWADRLERIPESITSQKDEYGSIRDRKAAATLQAITKRNIKKVVSTYFTGVDVKVKISTETWKENFSIIWADGPTVKEMRNTAKELQFFIPSYYYSDPYADYGNYGENKDTAPWRDAYGQPGDRYSHITDIKFERTLTDEGRAHVEAVAVDAFSDWLNEKDGQIKITFGEFCKMLEACGTSYNDFSGNIDTYTWDERRNDDGTTYYTAYVSRLRDLLTDICPLKVAKNDDRPKFKPTYGPTMKAIKKALGQNVFATQDTDDLHSWHPCEISELLTNIEGVRICGPYDYEGVKHYSPLYYTSHTIERKRREKFAALGIEINGARVLSISAETVAALRAEAADIDRQRAAWEAAQNGTANPTEQKTDTTDTNAAPAEGLTLEDIPGGVAVTGDSRTTFRNRKAIKAHGARWNNNTGRWEATDPEAVENLRAWFGQTATAAEESTNTTTEDTTTDTPEEQPAQPEQPTQEEQPKPEPEPTTDTPTDQKPEPEPAQEPEPPTAKNTTEDAPDLVALAAKLQEAKKAVIFCLNNPTGSVNFHGLEYWAGEVERLRKEILKAA